jgi:hypothetical protein
VSPEKKTANEEADLAMSLVGGTAPEPEPNSLEFFRPLAPARGLDKDEAVYVPFGGGPSTCRPSTK